jgi:hypothetical protein
MRSSIASRQALQSARSWIALQRSAETPKLRRKRTKVLGQRLKIELLETSNLEDLYKRQLYKQIEEALGFLLKCLINNICLEIVNFQERILPQNLRGGQLILTICRHYKRKIHQKLKKKEYQTYSRFSKTK